MRRVLVPLDGSGFSESIFPDARRLAGRDGELVLVRETTWPTLERDVFVDTTAVAEAEEYLQREAKMLRDEGVTVKTQSLVLANAASAINEAARIFETDLIAIATHGRGPLGRLFHGGVAWRALAHSPVPVLLRHFEDDGGGTDLEERPRRILVPLDGSAFAETALPAAQQLAKEWNASVSLVQVALDLPMVNLGHMPLSQVPSVDEEAVAHTHTYLRELAQRFEGEVVVAVEHGPVVETLVHYAERHAVTDIVLASHGRTGPSRVLLGSVADELIHRWNGPIIVVPAFATAQLKPQPVRKHESAQVSLA